MQNYFRITRIAILFLDESEHKYLLNYFGEKQELLSQGICTFFSMSVTLKSRNAEFKSQYRVTEIDEGFKWGDNYTMIDFDEFYSLTNDDFKLIF